MNYNIYYRRLGLSEQAREDEIRQAYRRLAMKLHPDVNPSPDAHQQFIEVGEAYEMLMYKVKQEMRAEDTAANTVMDAEPDLVSWEEVLREAREHARKQAEMKFDKLRREHEAFQKSGLYDVGLALRYFIHFMAVFVAIGLILFPLYIALTQEAAAFFYLFFFWIVGGFLLIYIFNNRKNWFDLGSFYFKPDVIRELFARKAVVGNETCFYCHGIPADGQPFEQSLLKVNDVQLIRGGPGVHQARYKRTYRTVRIPRSRKAFLLHLTGSIIKIFSILVFVFIIQPGSLLWSIILGALAGGIFSSLLLLLFRTRPKSMFLLNPYILIKLCIWLIFLGLVSYRTSGWHIYAGEYIYLTVAILLFFLDILVDPMIRLVFKNRAMTSFFRLPLQEKELLERGYVYALEIPIWSTLYPIIRWLL